MASRNSKGDMENQVERKQIAQRFREFRAKLGRRMKDLAKEIGISDVTISRYENGHQVPDSLVLRRISELTDLNIDWLLTGKGEPIKQKDRVDHPSLSLKSYTELPKGQIDRRRCSNLRLFINNISSNPESQAAIQEMLGLGCLGELGIAIVRQFVHNHVGTAHRIRLP